MVQLEYAIEGVSYSDAPELFFTCPVIFFPRMKVTEKKVVPEVFY
jgi:hypothetical protein